MSHLKAEGRKAFIWDFFGKIVIHGMGFIVTIFLARLLEPSDFGLIAMIMVIIGMAGVFTDIGLGSALIQRRRVHVIHYSSVFYFNIVVGFFLTIITYLTAPWISEFYNNQQLVPLVEVMSLLFLINAFSSVQNTKLRKELNYVILTKVSLMSSLISGIFGISLAFYGSGVWSLVAQALSMGIVYNIIIWKKAKWLPSVAFSWKALVQLWAFGFRVFLTGLLDAVYTRMDYLIIGKLFTPATLGFYQRAKSLNLMLIQYSSGSLMSVLFPILSKVQNDLPRFQNIIIKSFGVICFVVFLLFGNLYIIAEELIVILFSNKWLPSVEYFKLLALSGFAHPMNAILVNILISRGKSKLNLKLAIYKKIVAFSNLGIGFLYGIEGFLYGLVIVAMINTSMNIIYASQESNIPVLDFYKPIFIQGFLAVVTVLITLYLVDSLDVSDIIILIIKGTLFSSIYIVLNWIFKTSSFEYFFEQIYPLIIKISQKIKTLNRK